MSLEPELLARICAEPSNLELRLVYADRLLERGDPKGTFIAQQCELARLDVLDPRYASLLASTRRLEAAHSSTWLSEALSRAKLEPSRAAVRELLDPVFERGFLHRVTMSPRAVAEDWKWLARQEPIDGLELVVHEGLPKAQRGLVDPPNPRVLKVRAEGWVTDHSVGDVLAWGMPRLRELDLSGCDLGLTGCALLTNAETDLAENFEDWKAPPPFKQGQLERLVLRGCGVGDEGARMLFASDTLTALRVLDLGQCGLTEASTLKALRDSPHLCQLVSISLWGNSGLKGALGVLAGWSVLEQLERIAVPQVTTAAELGSLFPKASKRLRRLELSSAKELAKSPAALIGCAEALSHLDLGTTALGDAGWAELLAAGCTESLLELHANGCSLSDEAVFALTKSRLRRLVKLDLSSNKLTDEGLEALGGWAGLEHVTHLRLGNNRKVTAKGYEALMAASHFVPVTLDIGKTSDRTSILRLQKHYGEALLVG